MGSASELEGEIEGHGATAQLFEGDLADPHTPARLVAGCHARFGRIDLLVNNAAVMSFGPFRSVSVTELDHLYAVNFRAAYLLAQAVASTMVDDGVTGAIVNVSSVHQDRASDADSIYGSMKAALARATMSLALELAPSGIRVNGVAPGRITKAAGARATTDLAMASINSAIPLGRPGIPEDVARVVRFLASSDADYITGVIIAVDGGMNLPLIRAQVGDEQRYF